jgi:hypothetical protein
MDEEDSSYRLVIVGSGITAMYLAYHVSLYLRDTESEAKVLLISKDHHIGGRIKSLPLPEESGWMTEICATRYYQNLMPLLSSLVDELLLPTTKIPASRIPVVTPGPNPETMKATQKDFPVDEPKLTEGVTLAAAITIATGDYKRATEFVNSTGYTFQLRDMSLRSFYDEYHLSGEDETRLKTGFQCLPISLYQIIHEIGKVKLVLSAEVKSLVGKSDSIRVSFTKNDDKRRLKSCCARTLVLTGTMRDVKNIAVHGGNKSLDSWQERRSVLYKLYQPQASIKIYVEVQKPWWGESDMSKFTGYPLLTQMMYYSSNTILFYIVGPEADTLLNMYLQDLQASNKKMKHRCSRKWVKAAVAPTLVDYIKIHIPKIIATSIEEKTQPSHCQLSSISMILVSYVEQATATIRPVRSRRLGPDELCEYIQRGSIRTWEKSGKDGGGDNSRVFYLGGDLQPTGGGWVEYCLQSVNSHLNEIIHNLH